MQELAYHLQELIIVNRRIMNRFHKDEASMEYLRESFEERELHIGKLDEVIVKKSEENLSDAERASLKPLFERFAEQCEEIQEALSYVLDESRENLGDAVKSRKAEQGYNALR